MKRKTTFKDVLQASPLPKKLTLDEKLPYIFDLRWDCKTLRDLYFHKKVLTSEMLRYLSEAGYDTKDLPNG